MRLTVLLLTTLCFTIAHAPRVAMGQASFHENFEDIGPPSYSTPSVLAQRGWIFRNQSQPLGSRGYFSGITPDINIIYFAAQQGERYLAVDQGAVNQSGTMSVWAILPPIVNQQSGDPISLWARRLEGAAGFQIRYSPTGGTSTGTSASDVGDFTTVLLDVPSTSEGGWTRYEATAPGSGRIAIRYTASYQYGNFSPYTGFDTISIGTPPPPNCNQPPIPQPGQTVAWTAAGGPYVICENIAIPTGATVNIEAGTVIDFGPGKQLLVSGTLNIGGTESAPVRLSRGGDYYPSYIVAASGGVLSAAFVNFESELRLRQRATNATLADCRFADGGRLEVEEEAFARLERCTFDGSFCQFNMATGILQDCSFTGTQNFFFYGYTDFLGTNIFDGEPLRLVGSSHLILQPFTVRNVHVRNVTQDVGLRIDSNSVYVGQNVVLENNLYPMSVESEILPRSQVPATGNIHNAIDVRDGFMSRNSRWTNFGIPYRLTVQNNPSGPVTGMGIFIDPGVTVEHLLPNTFLAIVFDQMMLMGRPEAPIRLVNTLGNLAHHGPIFWASPDSRMEYVIAEGMSSGVTGTAATIPLWIENSILRFNQRAVEMRGSAHARVSGTQFIGNTVGTRGNVKLNSPDNPNSFEGNVVAVFGPFEGQVDARNNWWNSPTGPQHFTNPGGTGEVIGGTQEAVTVVPFLTERPNYENHPPVVRSLLHPGARDNQTAHFDRTPPPTRSGTKYILQWEATDDDEIVRQDVVMYWHPSGGGALQPIVIAADLPGTQRSLEFTIPEVGLQLSGRPNRLVISATDSRGQVGWDQVFLVIPSDRLEGLGEIEFDSSLYAGGTFHPREDLGPAGFSTTYPWEYTINAIFVYEADNVEVVRSVDRQYLTYDMPAFPYMSTDRARLVFQVRANNNDFKRYYGPYFTIRPDPRLGWEPPQVTMTSPPALPPGAQFAGGSVIPITWTASAQQGLYSFDIQASYDGGGSWHTIASQLDPQARSYDWRLPDFPVQGIPDLRIRVIARDEKMQNSAHGDDRIFSITPGTGPQPCYANCDGSTTAPILNVDDFTCFINEFAGAQSLPHGQQVEHYANCDGSTTAPALNVDDFTCFINQYAAGCP